MAPKGYTTRTALENYSLQVIDPTFYSQIDLWIEAIEKYIDNYTGRNFVGDAEDAESSKFYDGNGSTELLIDDCLEIETLKIDDVAVTDYLLYPANGERKYKIRLINSIFYWGRQNVEVKGRWGYSAAVPADITLAATVLLAGITAHADQTGKEVRSESIGSYSVSYADAKGWQDFDKAKKILDSYIRFTF